MEFLLGLDQEDIDDFDLQLEIENIENALDIDEEKEISLVNIGPGADLMVILIAINTIANVFLVGDKIVKGIDGFVELGNRIKSLVKKNKIQGIDKDAASLLAVEFLASCEDQISFIEKTHEHVIDYIHLEKLLPDRAPEDFIACPHNFYVQTYLVNDDKIYVLGISSVGKVEVIKCFEAGNPYFMREIEVSKND